MLPTFSTFLDTVARACYVYTHAQMWKMAKRMLVAVCSYLDGLFQCIQSEASQKSLKVDFARIDLDKTFLLGFESETGTTPDTKHVLSDEDKQVLESAEVVLGDGTFISHCLPLIQNAKWVHSTFAGVETIISVAATAPKFTLTRHVGTSFGQQMGEYVLAQIMIRERNLYDINCSMNQCKWQVLTRAPRMLPSLTIGILGAGSIGKRIAEMCKSMGMTVWALTRTNSNKVDFIDYNCQLPQLPQLLKSCDYVCNVLPSTSETKGLLDGDILKNCATKKSVLINLGRGDIIHESSLVHAINEGWVGGAILDVFGTEPLPKDSLLWNTPNICLTPHMSGLCNTEETGSVFIANLSRYLADQPLKYVVDFSRGY